MEQSTIELIHGLSHGVTIINFFVMVALIAYVFFLIRKIDKLFGVNAVNLIDASEEILKRIEFLNKWQKFGAKMMKENRELINEHDERVNKLFGVADEIIQALKESKPVKDSQSSPKS